MFAGLFVGGEVFLIPALFAAIFGSLSLGVVFFIALLAGVLSDLIWYIVGRRYIDPFIRRFGSDRFIKQSARVELVLRPHVFRILFISKFIYGTRVVVQILSGRSKVSTPAYVVVNFLGTASYLAVLIALIKGTQFALVDIVEIKHAVFLTGLVAIGLIGVLHLLVQWLWRKKVSVS